MSSSNATPRLEELIALLLEQQLSAEEEQELAAVLDTDAQARAIYRQAIKLHVLLSATHAPAPELAVEQLDSPTPESLFARGWRSAYETISNYITLSMLVSGLFITTILLSLALWTLPAIRHTISLEEAATTFVAKITDTHDANWDESSDGNFTNIDLFAGERLVLNEGLAEIRHASGATVALEGPATYTVESIDSGALQVGKLTARIDAKQTKGFSIETPTARIEDLGTEFGLEVDEQGKSDVRVLQGSVRVDARTVGAVTASVVLTTRETARVTGDGQGVVRLGTLPESDLPAQYDDLRERASGEYAERVLALRPVAYWRMDGDELLDSGPGQHRGTLYVQDDYRPWEPGKYGGALWLRGTRKRDGAAVSEYPASTTGKLTVAAWVLAESRPQWAMVATNWGHQKKIGQFHMGLMHNNGDLCAHVTQANGKYIHVREGAGSKIPLGRWQHIAFVADGTQIRLYRNGIEVATTNYDGTLLATLPPGMGIGVKLSDNSTTPVDKHWHGAIDELVLLHRALTPGEIRQLAGVLPAER